MTPEVFEQVHSEHGKRLMKKARVTNRKRDAADRRAGFAAPGDVTTDGWLRNAITAISCGIDGKDWTAVAEGLDMLQNAEVRVRTLVKGSDEEADERSVIGQLRETIATMFGLAHVFSGRRLEAGGVAGQMMLADVEQASKDHPGFKNRAGFLAACCRRAADVAEGKP